MPCKSAKVLQNIVNELSFHGFTAASIRLWVALNRNYISKQLGLKLKSTKKHVSSSDDIVEGNIIKDKILVCWKFASIFKAQYLPSLLVLILFNIIILRA